MLPSSRCLTAARSLTVCLLAALPLASAQSSFRSAPPIPATPAKASPSSAPSARPVPAQPAPAQSTPAPATPKPSQPTGGGNVTGHWKVVGWTLPGAVPVQGADMTLRLGGSTVSGTTGCNNLMGSASVGGNQLTFGALATTRRACGSLVGAQEAALLRALSGQTLTFTQVGDSLTLTAASGHRLDLRRSTLK